MTTASDDITDSTTPVTEITVATGDRYRVQGTAKDVERLVVDAARGSIMQLAWLIEAESGADLAVNPESVILLRPAPGAAAA